MQWGSKGIINRSICKNYEVPSIPGTLSQLKLFIRITWGRPCRLNLKCRLLRPTPADSDLVAWWGTQKSDFLTCCQVILMQVAQITLRKTHVVNVKMIRQKMINSWLETTSTSFHTHFLHLTAFSSSFSLPCPFTYSSLVSAQKLLPQVRLPWPTGHPLDSQLLPLPAFITSFDSS